MYKRQAITTQRAKGLPGIDVDWTVPTATAFAEYCMKTHRDEFKGREEIDEDLLLLL